MKIVDCRTFVVGNPWKNWIFVKLATDEGITGLGEATGGLSTKPHEAQVHELLPLIIGADPRDVSLLWDRMYKALFLNTNSAMAAVEMACWDILGRWLGQPVWRLVGGRQRTRIRAYANGWYTGPREPTFFAERAREVVAMGYTALKFDPFGNAYRFLERAEERRSLAIVAAVRDAVGPDVDLCIEGHDRFAVATAIRLGHALADYNPMWFETPVMSTDIEDTAAVARAIPVPVASGERFHRLGDFAALLATNAISIIQPETLACGGLLGLLKVAALAEAAEAFIAPHNAQSPFTTVVNVHAGAVVPNLLIQECFDDFLVPWSRQVLQGWCRVENGYLVVPEAPGWGVDLNEEEAARYPYSERNFLRLFEGGWETRRGVS